MIKQKQGNVMLSVALIGVHKNFLIFKGKHLRQSLFINKVEILLKNGPGGWFSNLNCWTLFGWDIEMWDHDPCSPPICYAQVFTTVAILIEQEI